MLKRLMAVVISGVLVLAVSMPVFAQGESASKAEGGESKGKQTRYEGVVVRASKDNSTLTVRKMGAQVEKTIHYDSNTRWVAQEHGAKKATDIDSSQVKDGDRLIIQGMQDKNGDIHATLISKRLTPTSMR
jgi:hypothetical protein